jgi:putative methyltransferase (TIGR04325 family)
MGWAKAVAVFMRDSFRYLRFGGSTYRGVFDSFSQAIAAAPRGAIGYNSPALARRYEEELELRLDCSDYPVLLHLDRIMGGASTVLDFGGNVGVHYLRYKTYLNLQEVQWIVCDVPEITAVGQKVCAPFPNVEFVNSIADLKKRKVDVLVAVGSLQYIENFNILSDLIREGIRPTHVVIDQLPLHEGEQFVTLQNGGPVYYPQHVFNRSDFVASITDLGYELTDEWSVMLYSCSIPFHPDKSVQEYAGLSFGEKDRASRRRSP